ncbi:MAG: c-type cytochrome [Myxococcaceae bacterium]|nr:c-type cytochrome [Myxococcaceae bacterium]
MHARRAQVLFFLTVGALLGCAPAPSGTATTLAVAAEAQREGDAAKGYDALVNGEYVTCGIPESLFAKTIGEAPENLRLPGRTGRNEKLRYDYTAITAANGAKLVSVNCLTCHAAVRDGKVVVGLGESQSDYTTDLAPFAEAAGQLVSDPAEKAEWRRWADRVVTVQPYILADTMGVNVADNLAPILFSHRDQKTLSWSARPLLDPPPTQVVPVDVPPWWNLKKKNSMFHTALGRGDQSRIMMSAALLCTDELAQAKAIDQSFPDVRAYLLSLKPPAYPYPLDAALVATGHQVFDQTCARCHGTYGEGGSYPNLVVVTEEVGTDPTLALATSAASPTRRFNDWFNGSFYGERARLVTTVGYVAPPLDGLWATAPYFHNGSVPTVADVLDSTHRPAFWTRDFTTYDFDRDRLGFRFTDVGHGKSDESDASKRRAIYDTTRPGYGNHGHTYGDALSPAEKAALLEYLKTL